PEWCAIPFTDYLAQRKKDHDAAYALPRDSEERRKAEEVNRQRDYARGRELKGWWYREMLATDSPLTERMVLMWHNHFTSQLNTVEDPRLMWEQNQLLRQHALGNFGHFSLAIPFDPAMHRYLDSNSNVARRPNENFAREVMELFTVGEGNYTEDDIKEAARAFTGYQIGAEGKPVLVAGQHDNGRKTVLGHKGVFDAKEIITILLLKEKNVALNIANKLWREFVDDQPDDKAIYEVAAAFYRSRYQITAGLRELLLQERFWDPAVRGNLIKSPTELLIGMARQLELDVKDPGVLVDFGKKLGQELFDPPNVKGWKGGNAWVSTHSLLARGEVLEAILGGRFGQAGSTPSGDAMMAPPSGGAMAGPAAAGDPAEAPKDKDDKKEKKKDKKEIPLAKQAVAEAAGKLAARSGWVAAARTAKEGGALAREMLLAIAPVAPIDSAWDFDRSLRAIILDPAFQVK
ncbi:MAG: DUF1800 domain-containing protein, partial [Planctomycetes bacterium]|nr:DUF1800 domain-containing protein [Planctomycetota bacterium]